MWFIWMTVAAAANLEGHWVLEATPDEARRALAEVVDASISNLPGWVQGRAKTSIMGNAPICQRYRFKNGTQDIAWACDGDDLFVVPRDRLASPFQVERDGKRAVALITLDNEKLKATFTAKNGRQTIIFRRAEDVLVAEYSLHSERLASPVQWTARYRREEVD